MAERLQDPHAIRPPSRRPLKVFATDPMAGRTAGNRITVDVENEDPKPGPRGDRVAVIDYDGAHDCFYQQVDLNTPAILMQGGLEPAEADPRFHQQMVYAVATRTLENFDRALGRWQSFQTREYDRLRLFPHAFHGANAFYSRELNGVLFGYFRADKENFGRNLPGQLVYTCLAHDIIVHEVTHAVVDRLRRHFLEPTNEDVLAFHEGFADIVALFQHFTFPELLRDAIQSSGTTLDTPGPMADLARQFGEATGMGQALRSAIGRKELVLGPSVMEPHERGSILVAAVFDGFFLAYQRRIRDLIRIATRGSGVLPKGDLHPDLIGRIAGEASATAQSILGMCIRAFDYLAPVDVTFSDYLRAMMTADYEMSHSDPLGLRESMIEGFRRRRIFAEDVASAAEESLLWPAPVNAPQIPVDSEQAILVYLMRTATNFGRPRMRKLDYEKGFIVDQDGEEVPGLTEDVAKALHRYASDHRDPLQLHPKLPIQVQGFHSVFRVAPSGRLVIELVAQFVQTDKTAIDALGGIPLRGGTTVVAAADGTIRYIIAKPIHLGGEQSVRDQAEARIRRQLGYLDIADALDPETSFMDDEGLKTRMKTRADFAKLHFR